MAQTEATVLFLGESGTGKELFARAVHHLSNRREKPFVAVNCAAIPETLIENELFGHERGAFTGANDRRQGKFELASSGTSRFSTRLASYPLRSRENFYEPLKSESLIVLEVARLYRSTSGLLQQPIETSKSAVDDGQFRGDLFFRLAVFPLEIPP